MTDYKPAEQRILEHMIDEYMRRVREAEAKGWNLDPAEARALATLENQLIGIGWPGETYGTPVASKGLTVWMSAFAVGWLLLGAFFLIGCTTIPARRYR